MKKLSVVNKNDVKEVNVDSIMKNLFENDAQNQIDELVKSNTISRKEVESFISIVRSDCNQKIANYTKQLKDEYQKNRNEMKTRLEIKKQNDINVFVVEATRDFSINTKPFFIKLNKIVMQYNKQSYEESCKLVKKYNEDCKSIINSIKAQNNFRVREFIKLHLDSNGIA